MIASWRRGFEAAKAMLVYSDGNRPGEKMGAAMYAGSSLISLGFNTYAKSHPLSPYSIHAEHSCLIRGRNASVGNLVVYIYRENHKGIAVCSKPCNNCMQLMRVAGVRRVRYINLQGKFVEEKL